jgi:hypothetical protein
VAIETEKASIVRTHDVHSAAWAVVEVQCVNLQFARVITMEEINYFKKETKG